LNAFIIGALDGKSGAFFFVVGFVGIVLFVETASTRRKGVDLCGQHRPGFTPTLKGAPDDDGLGLPKLLKSHYWNPFLLHPSGFGVNNKNARKSPNQT
jgi:hypothetical protein